MHFNAVPEPMSMVMLGCLSALSGLVTLEALEKAIEEGVRPTWKEVNVRAARIGYEKGIELKESFK